MQQQPRFSKKFFEAYVVARIEEIARNHGFVSTNGTAQLNANDSPERQRAYGQIMALEDALTFFNIGDVAY